MRTICTALLLTGAATALAAPVTYNLDPGHTYPSFEADHMGLSTWRGKFNESKGTVVWDREAGTGTVDVSIDMASIDFGHDKMNAHALKEDIFNVEKYPTAVYKGTLAGFEDGEPTKIEGELKLHGITRPLTLEINELTCKEHPVLKREVCGADAEGRFNREEFGISIGKAMGFDTDVLLRIQAEAVRAE